MKKKAFCTDCGREREMGCILKKQVFCTDVEERKKEGVY